MLLQRFKVRWLQKMAFLLCDPEDFTEEATRELELAVELRHVMMRFKEWD